MNDTAEISISTPRTQRRLRRAARARRRCAGRRRRRHCVVRARSRAASRQRRRFSTAAPPRCNFPPASAATGMRWPIACRICRGSRQGGVVVHWHGGGDFARRAPDDCAAALEIFDTAADYWRARSRGSCGAAGCAEQRRPFVAGVAARMTAPYKIPVSVLVVIHTADLQVLLLERADRPGFWQSVTGSQDAGETLARDRAPRSARGDRARCAATRT